MHDKQVSVGKLWEGIILLNTFNVTDNCYFLRDENEIRSHSRWLNDFL